MGVTSSVELLVLLTNESKVSISEYFSSFEVCFLSCCIKEDVRLLKVFTKINTIQVCKIYMIKLSGKCIIISETFFKFNLHF